MLIIFYVYSMTCIKSNIISSVCVNRLEDVLWSEGDTDVIERGRVHFIRCNYCDFWALLITKKKFSILKELLAKYLVVATTI